jgi:hypothetical protein
VSTWEAPGEILPAPSHAGRIRSVGKVAKSRSVLVGQLVLDLVEPALLVSDEADSSDDKDNEQELHGITS